MTRINVGIPPHKLSRQHLLAEHREIKRIPNMIASGRANLDGIPEKFSLGKGHVKFFYNKLQYLKWRYIRLYDECCMRGYKVEDYRGAWDGVPHELMNDWLDVHTDDVQLIKDRLMAKDPGFYSKTL